MSPWGGIARCYQGTLSPWERLELFLFLFHPFHYLGENLGEYFCCWGRALDLWMQEQHPNKRNCQLTLLWLSRVELFLWNVFIPLLPSSGKRLFSISCYFPPSFHPILIFKSVFAALLWFPPRVSFSSASSSRVLLNHHKLEPSKHLAGKENKSFIPNPSQRKKYSHFSAELLLFHLPWSCSRESSRDVLFLEGREGEGCRNIQLWGRDWSRGVDAALSEELCCFFSPPLHPCDPQLLSSRTNSFNWSWRHLLVRNQLQLKTSQGEKIKIRKIKTTNNEDF